jgi:hypothetical protein
VPATPPIEFAGSHPTSFSFAIAAAGTRRPRWPGAVTPRHGVNEAGEGGPIHLVWAPDRSDGRNLRKPVLILVAHSSNLSLLKISPLERTSGKGLVPRSMFLFVPNNGNQAEASRKLGFDG